MGYKNIQVIIKCDRPKSARNRCLIELVACVLCCHIAVMTFPLMCVLLL